MIRRVVITGCGVVSPIGQTRATVWDALQAGRSGVKRICSIPTETLPIKSGGEVQDFSGRIDDFGPLSDATKKNIRKGLKVMCREIQMGVAAAQLALNDAGLDLGQTAPERAGVVYGSDYIMTLPDEFAAGVHACQGDQGRFEMEAWPAKGMPQVTPLWLLKYLPNMPACHVAIYNDLRGPNNSITVREASANLAMLEAHTAIVRDSADVMLVGGTGSRIHSLRTTHTVLQEECASGDEDPATLARPFDRDRRGMVVGEGAATFVLEELSHAQRRGATIFAEVVGFGASAVLRRGGLADRATALANAMRRALEVAGLRPPEVGHLHAHGLGTQSSDVAEAEAIHRVFGEWGARVPVVAAKSYFGNLGAASGMVELLSSVLALQAGCLFPTLNYQTPDPACRLRVVTDGETPSGESVLNVNVTPQAQASAIVLRRYSA